MATQPRLYGGREGGFVDWWGDRPILILIQRTFRCVGPLGEVAGIVGMIGAGIAQVPIARGTVKGNAAMPVGFQLSAAERAGNRLSINFLLAAGAGWHKAAISSTSQKGA